jgi:uncharacterized membrane protein YcgQ (UPF0703/DUF1980 family)
MIVTNSGIIFTIKGLTLEQLIIMMYCLFCFTSMFTTAEVPILYFTRFASNWQFSAINSIIFSSDHRHSLRKQFIFIFRLIPRLSSSGINKNAVVVPQSKNPTVFVTASTLQAPNSKQKRHTLARISIQGPAAGGSVSRYSWQISLPDNPNEPFKYHIVL